MMISTVLQTHLFIASIWRTCRTKPTNVVFS